jgi:hypothetical protein
MTDTPTFTSRRSAIGFGTLALGLPALGSAFASGAQAQTAGKPLDLSNKADFLTALQKMRGALDGRICMGYVKGLYYGVVDDRITPLYGVLGGTFSRYKKLANGNFEGRTFEVAYFTDWTTGQLLDTFKNPYTGETVSVPQTRMGPSTIIITPDGLQIGGGGGLPGMNVAHRFLPARVVNNDVWIVEESIVGTSPDSKGPKFSYNEVTTMQTTLSELNDPKLMQTPTHVHYSVVVSWRPWLKMGDRPGHLMGNAAGRRLNKMTDYPIEYQEWTKKYHADVWADPSAILDGKKA